MPVANEGRQVLQSSDHFVVFHRGDPLVQIGYRLVEFNLADEVKRISVFRRDLVGEKLEILSPLFGSQSRKRSFSMSKVASKEQDAEQFFHKHISLRLGRVLRARVACRCPVRRCWCSPERSKASVPTWRSGSIVLDAQPARRV